METQIKRSLISLRKIANLSDSSRIDTTRGDIDEFVDTIGGQVYRACFDSRERALKLLLSKYAEVKELVRFIVESGKFTDSLPTLKTSLEKSKEGLLLYKSNVRYKDDKQVKSTIEHLLEEEIPAQITYIESILNN